MASQVNASLCCALQPEHTRPISSDLHLWLHVFRARTLVGLQLWSSDDLVLNNLHTGKWNKRCTPKVLIHAAFMTHKLMWILCACAERGGWGADAQSRERGGACICAAPRQAVPALVHHQPSHWHAVLLKGESGVVMHCVLFIVRRSLCTVFGVARAVC